MKSGSQALADVLAGGAIKRKVVADIVYGSARLIEDLPIDTWTFTGDIDGAIKTGGSVTVAYTDDFATSVTPHQLTDALAPFGQELHAYMVVDVGESVERIPLGKYRIDDIPSASEAQQRFRNGVITVGSKVQLTLLDRFVVLSRAKFRSLQKPATTSAWAEIARLTKMPVNRNVPDAAIPASLVYDRDRLEAVQLLAGVLGGRAWMTDRGTVSILPHEPGAVVATLKVGEEGTVVETQYSMHSEGVYNVVVGDFETPAGVPIHVEAEITSGPLAVTGPYGEYVLEYPGDKSLIESPAQAQAAVDQQLARSSVTESYVLPVQCVPNPLLEIGDVVEVKQLARRIIGRILTLTLGDSGPMSLNLGVISDKPI